ncbi:uncharacterized protein MKK02DRAFT_41000 [Dioszegia hungarica]|uniref:Uncharacterized protein n=1 Tax=Dioszegia hungarica TaxID=4972 RepID=A0AA38H2Z1_9TREE|nr:uncharacterized protein MKK02DRAFT_41000 [Dioszegia hungarica]KAI9632691.1 hypothetical protein MKK02DRAFT_41000 [Dioszegia hungarica]
MPPTAAAQPERQSLLQGSSIHSQPHRLSHARISFPSSSSSAFATDASEAESTLVGSDRGSGVRSGKSRLGAVGEGEVRRKEGVPKLSRECLWSEIKCYGSYILPVFLVFGVLVIGVSLTVVGIKLGWFK